MNEAKRNELAAVAGSTIFVVMTLDRISMERLMQQPGYWREADAQKRADRLNAREQDSFSYYVAPIRMHKESNAEAQERPTRAQ